MYRIELNEESTIVYDPIMLSKIVEERVMYLDNNRFFRKYYRFRATNFYGGSATGDVIGCNLYCKYCWSLGINKYSNLKNIGFYMGPEEAALKLLEIAAKNNFRYIRLSGGEPTIGFNHVIQLLKMVNGFTSFNKIRFILETNGILIGYGKEYVEELLKFPFVIVRVSLKGCSPDEFKTITGVCGEFYEYQLKAIEYLFEYNVDTIIAVTIGFCSKESFTRLIERLLRIREDIIYRIELEVAKLYPNVIKMLYEAKLFPWIAVDPKENILLRGEDVEQFIRKRYKEYRESDHTDISKL